MNRGTRGSWLLLGLVAIAPLAAVAAAEAGKSRVELLFADGLRMAEANRVDQAIEVFSGLTRDYPRLPQPFIQLAALQARRGNLQAAVTALQAALELQTDSAALQEQLGDLYVELAEHAYRSALDARNPPASVRKKYSTVEALNPAPAAQ